jgi:hypothetical protein
MHDMTDESQYSRVSTREIGALTPMSRTGYLITHLFIAPYVL